MSDRIPHDSTLGRRLHDLAWELGDGSNLSYMDIIAGLEKADAAVDLEAASNFLYACSPRCKYMKGTGHCPDHAAAVQKVVFAALGR